MKNAREFFSKLYRLNLEKIAHRLGIKETISNVFRTHKPKIMVSDRLSKEVIRYIHIGYPKAGSTALQRGFFGQDPHLFHLGCGNHSNKKYWDDHGYVSSEVNLAMEIDLRYKGDLSYDPAGVKSVFEKYFRIAQSNQKIHAVGVSNENLCFNWHGGIDTVTKAKRLQNIFGKKTKVIMVVRQQKGLIESLYKETVRFGYAGSFDEYLKYIWTYQDRNFLYDFHFDLVYRLYCDLFSRENVHVMFFEDFQDDNKAFLSDLGKILGLTTEINEITRRYNEQLTSKQLAIQLELNRRTQHGFQKSIMNPFDTHRHVTYYLDSLAEKSIDDEVYLDYHLRKKLNELATDLDLSLQIPEISLKWESQYARQIKDQLIVSNLEFEALINSEKIRKYNYTAF
ncbi:sulfotransferase domain-containing protein [Marinoscillum pacificum]|uniref:sulfotransferase domain-containing protein n=1 Tax=Marinoscillum pacificum TaxID=392723 RepID=UPI00215834AB|nr:sulfotransferase domain-containing protein [Marinoscillum pacificum]